MKRIAAVLGGLVLLLAAAQLILPRIAESRLRHQLEREADVREVSVHAFPALKLLFGDADSVKVRLGEVHAGTSHFADMLASTERTGDLDASAASLDLGPLVLRDLRLRKRGDSLTGQASLDRADLDRALPVDVGLRPINTADGQLVLEASAGPISVRARLAASDGKLRISPDGLLGGFAALTLFSDPRLDVLGVGSRPRTDGYTFTARGRLT
jgi:DUF2993 family protein